MRTGIRKDGSTNVIKIYYVWTALKIFIAPSRYKSLSLAKSQSKNRKNREFI